MIKYGTHANIENVEKKSTIIGPLSPLSPSFLTQVYAKPAHIPPAKPIIGDEERAAVDRVLRSGMIAQGPEVASRLRNLVLQ